MDEKNLIERLVEENKSLSKKLRKLSSKGKSFVMENEKQFTDLLMHIQNFQSNGKSRYFFERKNKKGTGSEQVFKLNTFVADLIEFKARANVAPEMVNSRISMDKGSLIRSLEEGRIKRPRGDAGILARKQDSVEKAEQTAKEIAKLLEDPAPAVRSVTIEDDEAKKTGKRRATKRFQKEGDIAPPNFE